MCRAVTKVSILVLALLPGCGGEEPAEKVYPVKGEVYFRGEPAAGAMVFLHPVGQPNGRILTGKVEGDGTFQITTRTRNDGAPPGRYVVTLSWSETVKVNDVERETPDRFGRRYADPGRPAATVEVKPRANQLPRIELK